jgi:hypothetical protein
MLEVLGAYLGPEARCLTEAIFLSPSSKLGGTQDVSVGNFKTPSVSQIIRRRIVL